jgi:hypothetical protein
MKRKTVIILSLSSFIVGLTIGTLLGFPEISERGKCLLSGDIGKVDKYKKDVVNEQIDVVYNRLLTDKEFSERALTSLTVINERVEEFKANADMSIDACEEIKEMAETKKDMEKVSSFSAKALINTNNALDAVKKILNGDKSFDIEDLANNAILSYMLMDRSASGAKKYVLKVDDFLKTNGIKDYEYLAFTRDQWAKYSAIDAVINGNRDELNFWKKQKSLLSNNEYERVFNNLSNDLRLQLLAENALVAKLGINSTDVLSIAILRNNEEFLNNISKDYDEVESLNAIYSLNSSITSGCIMNNSLLDAIVALSVSY